MLFIVVGRVADGSQTMDEDILICGNDQTPWRGFCIKRASDWLDGYQICTGQEACSRGIRIVCQMMTDVAEVERTIVVNGEMSEDMDVVCG